SVKNYASMDIVIDPNNTNLLYATTDGYGVFKSTDGGKSWSQTNLSIANAESIFMNPNNSLEMYALDNVRQSSIEGTRDGWQTWKYMDKTGLPTDMDPKKGIIEENLRSLTFDSKGNIFLATVKGLYKYSAQSVSSFVINSSAGLGGSISPSGTITVDYGDTKTFTITPNPGYKIKDVKVDGISVGAVSTYTFSNVNSNHLIEASFELKEGIKLPIWPMFHYDAQHTGQCPYDTSTNNGSLNWKFKTGSWIYSSPTIASDGTVYIGSYDHYLYAINPNGTLKWKYQLSEAIWGSSAIGVDGTIYIGSIDGNFYALNPDGTVKWTYKVANGIYSSATVTSDGTIYIGSSGPTVDNYLYAINSDGSLKWKNKIGSISSSPAIGIDGTIYIGTGNAGQLLYAINPDGKIKWSYTLGTSVDSSPAIDKDGTIYIGDDKYLYAINSDGILKWKYQTGDWVNSSPAIASDGTVYIGSYDHYLYAINSDGTLKWRYQARSEIKSAPVIGSDGTIYVGSWDRYLYAINTNGTLKWKLETDGSIENSSPAIGSDGTIYVGSDDHYLYAIGRQFTITASTGPGGTISPSGTITVNYGDSKTFTITPNTGYKISNVKVDGISVGAVSSYTFSNITSNHTIEASFEKLITQTIIILQIGSPTFTVNGSLRALDSPPIIKNNRTLLPIRAVVEALNGTVSWDGTQKKVTVSLGSNTIELWIGKSSALVNGIDTPIDSSNPKVVPEIINGRTMLPLRFVAESLGCDVQWDSATKTITITYGG
ncbi:MAG: PQQ-binding-like beta-propeller repeat protein, partial [Candidatus Nanoarchaeia archaeon]|nr:PQQ-binding-like beta-propeller repeat protein [Candidatus Jingweiarchaeum tengchongense]